MAVLGSSITPPTGLEEHFRALGWTIVEVEAARYAPPNAEHPMVWLPEQTDDWVFLRRPDLIRAIFAVKNPAIAVMFKLKFS